MKLTLKKPAVPRVYVKMTNAVDGRIRYKTVYNATADRLMDELLRLVEGSGSAKADEARGRKIPD